LISSSYEIKTSGIFFYKYGTADTLTQEIFYFLARRQWARWQFCKNIPVSFDFITT